MSKKIRILMAATGIILLLLAVFYPIIVEFFL